MAVEAGGGAGVARAFWIVGRAHGELRAEPLRAPNPDEVVVRARASAISRGTEGLIFHGRVPESERQRMRCPFQVGEFPWPIKYGYASVGVIDDGPAAVVGQRVFCLHPHQDRYLVPRAAARAIPDAVSNERATLAANMETALNGLWDAPPVAGMRVAVIGAGLVGLFVAWLAGRRAGTGVEIVDRDRARIALAREFGLDARTPEAASHDAAVIFHASGHPEGLALALELAGFEATIVELSWYGDQPVTLPLGGAFHSRRLTIKSSQVGAVATAMRAAKTRADRLSEALGLLAEPRFDMLIGERVAFGDLPATMPRITAFATTPPGVVVTYPE